MQYVLVVLNVTVDSIKAGVATDEAVPAHEPAQIASFSVAGKSEGDRYVLPLTLFSTITL